MRPVTLTAIALVLTLTSGARAQDDQAGASASFRQAERAYAADDYLEALRLFRQAYEAAPHPTVRFHVALCLERLGRMRDAWSEMTEVAATTGLTDAQRRDAMRQVDRLRGELVTLRIDGEPAGASVRVDERPLCTLPCEVPVDPGDHDVVIENESGRSSAHVSGLRGGSVAVRLRIEPTQTVSPVLPAAVVPVDEPVAQPIAPVEAPPSTPRARGGVGWLLVTGSVVAAIGIGGIIGLGLHATDVHTAWLDDPTQSLHDEGVLFRDLTNAAIGVAIGGGVLVLLDVLLALGGEGSGERASVDDRVVRF